MEDAKWFVVHTYSGYENKVAENIEQVAINRNMQDQILEVRVPTIKVTEKKTVRENGKPVEKEVERDEKTYPCYVFVKVAIYYDEKQDEKKMRDETWYVIRNTRGVTGFVGPESKPRPLSDREVIAMGVEKHVIEVNYAVGDYVTIVDDGSFDGTQGTVDMIDIENDTVRVIISMFGRETPIELSLDQVEPAFD